MYCNNCGGKIKSGALVCSKCGAKQDDTGISYYQNGSNYSDYECHLNNINIEQPERGIGSFFKRHADNKKEIDSAEKYLRNESKKTQKSAINKSDNINTKSYNESKSQNANNEKSTMDSLKETASEVKKCNSRCLAGCIFSLIGLFFMNIFGIIGLVISIGAYKQCSEPKDKKLAMVGIVAGAISTFIFVGVIISTIIRLVLYF